MTLRNQLLRWLLIPLVALLVIDAAGSYFIAARVSQTVYDGELIEIARELLLHVASAPDGTLRFRLSPEAERTLLLDQQDRVYYAVRAPDGHLVAGDAALPASSAAAGHDGIRFYNATAQGRTVRVARLVSALPDTRPAQTVVVEIAETLNKRHDLASLILVSVILPQLVLIAIAGLLVWFGVAHGLAPLNRLREAVGARSHLDLSPIAAEDAPAEVHPLLNAINDLLARLNEVLTFQSRFIADAAHQLRTPVAGLKTHIEVALRENDLAQTKHALAHLYTGVERLSRLVSQLLSLARNEPNTVRTLNFVSLDLNKLARETTMEWVPEAYKKNIDLGFEGSDTPALTNGDPVRLGELINNLLDNAIRYSRDRGRVTVRVACGERQRLSVSDDGPRIPAEERGRVFERFHRLLGSHVSGSGLGLAIAQEIARLHDAEISLEDDIDGVGNTFTVSFPPV
jgi:two-component system sensor histidine kinase TctE